MYKYVDCLRTSSLSSMAAWQLNESRGLGRDDRIWKLSKQRGLSVGRDSDCDVQILSQSVEKKQCIIEWNQKKESYVIRDLGSVNGTFVNGLLLRSGRVALRHGDSLRFGYDKGHLFRVKKVEPVPSNPPHSLPSPAPPPSPPHHPSISTSSTQTLPAHHNLTSPQVSGVQYVPIPSVSPAMIFPTVQPYVLPQPIYSPHVPQVGHMTGHVTPSPHIMEFVNPHGSVPTPLPTLPPFHYPSTPVTPKTTQTAVSPLPGNGPTEPRTDPKTEQPVSRNSSSVSPRKDGRRSVSLSSSDMPRLSEVSSLYGLPSWWGDNEDPIDVTRKDSSRLAHREAQILRDISPPRPRSSSVYDTSQHSSKATVSVTRGNAQGEVGSNEGTKSPNLVWTVESGPSRRSRAIPPKWRRNIRSADSSPIRRPGSEGQSLSSNATPVRMGKNTSSKEFTPLSHRVTATKPPSGSRKTGKRVSPSPVRSSRELNSAKEQEKLTSSSTRKTASSNTPSDPVHSPEVSPPPATEGLRSHSDIGVGSRENADETFVVTSPPEDERPGSARKQWSHEPMQPHNSLMMASIEARMRRLNKLAKNTYLSLTAVKHGRQPQPHDLSCPSPVDSESHLPEWKFFNKEVDSIFRNIRSVEKWLKDIDMTVAGLQLHREGKGEEGRGEEESVDGEGENEAALDFPDTFCSSESEGVPFQDSIEDLCTSSSD